MKERKRKKQQIKISEFGSALHWKISLNKVDVNKKKTINFPKNVFYENENKCEFINHFLAKKVIETTIWQRVGDKRRV